MIEALVWVDSLVARMPIVGRLRGAVLDSLFGRAEDYDYVSTTTPAGPPPAV